MVGDYFEREENAGKSYCARMVVTRVVEKLGGGLITTRK